jgi:DNA-binding transcriptional ArsR family regulator
MATLVDDYKGEVVSGTCSVVSRKELAAAVSPGALRILELLAASPSYPKALASRLKVHEQNVYYHIHRLVRAGLIRVVREEAVKGAVAKHYGVEHDALALVVRPLARTQKVSYTKEAHLRFLHPFIREGRFDGLVVMGSPEPHGPMKSRAKDGAAVAQLGLYLGAFLASSPGACVKLDTEMRDEDLRSNLIVIGGPGVNTVAARLNSRLPVRLERHQSDVFTAFVSTVSQRIYPEESTGVVVKAPNPFAKGKQVLVLMGRRWAGTRAAVLALLQRFDEICAGNSRNPKVMARVVEGVDMDSDGMVDAVEMLE